MPAIETVMLIMGILTLALGILGFLVSLNILTAAILGNWLNNISKWALYLIPIVTFYFGYLLGGYNEFNKKQSYFLSQRKVIDSLKKEFISNEYIFQQERYKTVNFFLKQLQYCYENPPTDNFLVLYEHENYSGRRLYLPLDNYPDLFLIGFIDLVSSLSIKGKIALEVFKDVNYEGDYLPISGSIPSLNFDLKWNDAISSIKMKMIEVRKIKGKK